MICSASAYEKNHSFEYNAFGWYVTPKAAATGRKSDDETSYYGSDNSSSEEDSVNNLSSNLQNNNRDQQLNINQHSSVSFSTEDEEPNVVQPRSLMASSYGPTSERWFVLTMVCLSVAVRSYISVVYGQINDVFSVYFDVSPSSIDWITNLNPLTTLVCISVFIFRNHKKFNLRYLCLLMASTGFLGTALLTFATTTRDRGFVISLVGQIFMGVNNAIVMTIPPLVTTTWFPVGEIATALAFVMGFVGFGEALGSYLPGVVVFLEVDSELMRMVNGSGTIVESSGNEITDDSGLFGIVRYNLVMLFVFTAGIQILLLIFMIAFLKERPKIPPSYAELVVRKLHKRDEKLRHDRVIETNGETSDTNSITSTVIRSFQSSKSALCLFKNKMFVITAVLYGMVAASASTSITLLSSFIRVVLGKNVGGDALSGKIMTVLWICFVVGSFAGGRILDAYRCYRRLTIVGLCGVTLGCFGISSSLWGQNEIVLYCAHIILGFSMGMTETTLFEIASEVTYPAPPLTFTALLIVSWMIFFVAYQTIGRYLFNNIQSTALASSAPWVCASICLVVAICVFHPQQKRSNEVKRKTTERTPLLFANTP